MTGPREGVRRHPSRTGDELSLDERRLRAVAEPLDVEAVRWRPYPLLGVRNPVRKTEYRALFPGFPEREPALCTCTDYARRGLGNCKHLEAAWRWLRGASREARAAEEPERSDEALWAEIDRRLAAGPPLSARDVRQLGRVGAVLIERSPDPG